MITAENPDFKETPFKRIAQFNSRELTKKSQEDTPLVSVVVPFYNKGYEVFETLQLLLAQTLQQIEIILVDDGSTQKTSLQVLKEVQKTYKDSPVTLIKKKKNSGPSSSRNLGVEKAAAEFVAFIDSDDLIEPTTLEKWYWYLLTHPNVSFVNSYNVGFGAFEYLWNRGTKDYHSFVDENNLAIFSLVRKKDFIEVGGFDESVKAGLEDWDLWLKLGNQGKWGYTIPEYLTWYRRKPSHSDWDNMFDSEKFNAFKLRNREKYPDFYPRVQAFTPLSQPVKVEPVNEYKKLKGKNRILLIFPWLEMGGADKFNFEFMRELRPDYDYTIVCTVRGQNKWKHEFAKYTEDIHVLFHFLDFHNYYEYIKYLIESRKPSLVLISNSEYGYKILPALKTQFPQLPFMDYIHMEEEYWKNGGFPAMSIKVKQFLSQTLVCTRHLKKWMVDRGGNADRIDTVYINVDSRKWRPADNIAALRRELKLPRESVIIFFAGRVHPQKQPMVLAKSIEKVARFTDNFLMVVAGDGPMLGQLQSYVSSKGLDKYFLFLGGIPNDEVKRYLQASDVFFLPSLHEGLALGIYEAMACAKTVVGADVGGQKELVTEDLGVLIQRSNEEQESSEYAQILVDRINNPRKTKQMGKKSRLRIEQGFDIAKMASDMRTALDDVLRKNVEISGTELAQAYSAVCTELFETAAISDRLWNDLEKQRSINEDHQRTVNYYRNLVEQLEYQLQELKKTEAWYKNLLEDAEHKYNELKKSELWHKDELQKVIEFHESEVKKINKWHEEQYKGIPVWVRTIFKKI